jgi:hypothetical protein
MTTAREVWVVERGTVERGWLVLSMHASQGAAMRQAVNLLGPSEAYRIVRYVPEEVKP